MTAVTHGADPDALDRLADELAHTAERIALIGRHHATALDDVRWSGPDADRARAHWAYLSVTVVRPASDALAHAALHAGAQADEQRRVSESPAPAASSAAAPSSTATGPAGSAASTADGVVDRAVSLDRVAAILQETPELATMATAARAWENGLDQATYGLASDVLGDASRITRHGGALLSGIGVATDVHDVVRAASDGDAAGVVVPGVGLGIAGAGLAGASSAGPVGAAWGIGTAVGGAAHDAMQGTRYGDIVESMTDEAFRENGAWGITQVPGILGLAAYERIRESIGDDD